MPLKIPPDPVGTVDSADEFMISDSNTGFDPNSLVEDAIEIQKEDMSTMPIDMFVVLDMVFCKKNRKPYKKSKVKKILSYTNDPSKTQLKVPLSIEEFGFFSYYVTNYMVSEKSKDSIYCGLTKVTLQARQNNKVISSTEIHATNIKKSKDMIGRKTVLTSIQVDDTCGLDSDKIQTKLVFQAMWTN